VFGLLVEDEGFVEDFGEGVSCEVAVGGAEAAGEDDEGGVAGRAAEHLDEAGEIVGGGGELDGHDAEIDELLGEPAGVGIEELAGEKLIAGGEEDGGGVGCGHGGG
jgi:hypothetical protein